ncbi:MAG TPA: hypothetical protein VF759_17515 [Allosphingosinicella sp.]
MNRANGAVQQELMHLLDQGCVGFRESADAGPAASASWAIEDAAEFHHREQRYSKARYRNNRGQVAERKIDGLAVNLYHGFVGQRHWIHADVAGRPE